MDKISLYKFVITTFVVFIIWNIVQKLCDNADKTEGFDSMQESQESSPEFSQEFSQEIVTKPCGFYLRKNRYLMNGPPRQSYYTINSDKTGENRGDFDWRVLHEAGPNNTTEDLLWQHVEPRMILQDNCLKCGEFGPKSNYNVPTGIASAFTNSYDGNMDNLIPPSLVEDESRNMLCPNK